MTQQDYITSFSLSASALKEFFKDIPDDVYTVKHLVLTRPHQYQAVTQNANIMLHAQRRLIESADQISKVPPGLADAVIDVVGAYRLLVQLAKKCQRFVCDTYVSENEARRGQSAAALILSADLLSSSINKYINALNADHENGEEISKSGLAFSNKLIDLMTKFDEFSSVVNM